MHHKRLRREQMSLCGFMVLAMGSRAVRGGMPPLHTIDADHTWIPKPRIAPEKTGMPGRARV